MGCGFRAVRYVLAQRSCCEFEGRVAHYPLPFLEAALLLIRDDLLLKRGVSIGHGQGVVAFGQTKRGPYLLDLACFRKLVVVVLTVLG